MINLGDFSGVKVGDIFPANDNSSVIDFSQWREADLMFKDLDKKYNDKFPNTFPTNNVIFGKQPPDCIKLDERIKELSFDIEQLNKTTPTYSSGLEITKSNNPNVLKLYLLRKMLLRDKTWFNEFNCTDILEAKKTEDNAKMLTEQSAKSEKKVLEKGFKEQYIYIGFGSVILLVALYIVTRNKK
jgi:hypothetical protein